MAGSQESCRFQNFRIFEQLSPETIGPNYNFRSSDEPLPTYSYKENQFRQPNEEVYVLCGSSFIFNLIFFNFV